MADNNVQVQFGAQIAGAVSGIKQVGDQLGSLRPQVQSLQSAFDGLGSMLRGVLTYFGAREVIQMADSFKLLEGRIKLSTQSADEFHQAFKGIMDISSKTGASLETTTNIFQRLAQTRKEINATTGDMLQFTETVSKLGVMSGASQDSLKFGLTQLGQSLSSNVVRAEEFNSIMENIPAVGKAIADELGVSTGQLRNLVINGELLSKDVFAALLNQSEEVNRQFDQFPKTVGMAFAQAKNEIMGMVGSIDQATSATTGLTEIIWALSKVVQVVGTAFTAVFTGIRTLILSVFAAIETAARGAMEFMNLVIRGANTLGANISLIDTSGMDNFQKAVYDATAESFKGGVSDAAQSTASILAGIRTQLNGGGSSAPGSTRPISKNYAEVAAGLGGDNKEAKKAQQERLKMALDELDTNRQIAQAKIDDLRKNLDTEVNLGRMSETKKLQMLRQYEQQSYEIDRDALLRSAELDGLTVAQKQRLYNQLRILKQKHENQMQEINRKSAEAQRAKYEQVADAITGAFRGSVQGVLMGTQTIGQAIANMATNVLASLGGMLAEMAAKWLLNQIIGQTAAATQAFTTVQAHAAEAGSAAYASTAAIPVIGPAMAPAAAATAYAGAAAYSAAIPAFAVGAWELPGDTLAMVHKGETIMDASSARTFREGMARTGGQMPSSGSGGSTHINIHAVDANSFKRMLANNAATITKTIKKAARGFDSNLSPAMRGK